MLALLILTGVYLTSGRLGLSLGAANRFATLIWLPSGLAVSALFLLGTDLWPAILLGAFLVNRLNGAPLPVAVGIGIGNTLEALICTALLKREKVHPGLESLHDVLVLVLLAIPLSALIGATVGVSSLALGGVIGWSAAPVTWSTWWLGDAMSLVLVAPLLLTWSAWPQASPPRARLVEVGLLTMSVLLVGLFVFLGLGHPKHWDYPITHLVFPLLIWAALRFGPRGATAVIATFAGLAVVGTVQGVSPFATGNLWLRLLSLQSFMGITAATTLILATILAERRTLERQKDEFVSLISHELRTPLTSLLGYTELLQRDLAGSDHSRALGILARMEVQGNKLCRLIADLFVLAQILAGDLTFSEEAVDVDALVNEVVEQLQHTDSQPHISIQGSAVGPIVGDRERLYQVLMNLLTNAMTYSPQGGQIIIHLASTAADLMVSVQVFGSGISRSGQKEIFERFYLKAGEQGRTATGLGVGLYIAQQIIEHYGGKLRVERMEGQCATFTFSLPTRCSP